MEMCPTCPRAAYLELLAINREAYVTALETGPTQPAREYGLSERAVNLHENARKVAGIMREGMNRVTGETMSCAEDTECQQARVCPLNLLYDGIEINVRKALGEPLVRFARPVSPLALEVSPYLPLDKQIEVIGGRRTGELVLNQLIRLRAPYVFSGHKRQSEG